MRGVRGIDDLKLSHCIRHAGRFEFGLHVIVAPYDQSFAQPRPLISDGRTQNTGVVTFREDHPCLGGARPGMNAAQNVCCRVHPPFEADLIGVHINDGPARRTRFHAGTRDSRRNAIDETRIEGGGNDIVTPKTEVLAISHGDLVRHILARQGSQCLGAGNLHCVIDRTGVDVQRPPEEIGKTKDVVHLVGVIRAPRRDDCIGPHGVGFLGRDLRVGVGHGENDGIGGHRLDHGLRNCTFGGNAQEYIRAHHRLFQRTQIRAGGMG